MKALSAGPEARADRPASAVLHDEANVRIVGFRLEPGQRIPPHHSSSTVTVHVTEGRGTFIGADGRAELAAGETAVYAPGETHAIEAGDAPLRFLAIIAPRPGG
ncbi:MAG TPA: cupin domain-containing protein [Longimicrobiales bacterium]